MPTRLFEMFMNSMNEMSTSGIILRVALVVCSMFATIHLLSLWGTRYGDHHTMSKSLFLSIVLHGCFCLGWATVAESYPRRSIGTEPEAVPIPITFADSDDSAPEPGTGKLPVWHSGASAHRRLCGCHETPGSLTRQDRDSVTPDVESPQVDKAPEMTVEPDLPEFATQAEENGPDLEQSSVDSPKSVASNPMAVEQPTQEARPEVSLLMGCERTQNEYFAPGRCHRGHSASGIHSRHVVTNQRLCRRRCVNDVAIRNRDGCVTETTRRSEQ